MWLDNPWLRFSLSGTLILIYWIADRLARRHSVAAQREFGLPRAVRIVIFCSITAYYLLIKPFGGAIAGGAGNAIGIAIALLASWLRWATRDGVAAIRYPATASRALFYFALPLAVGVPLGWLALTVPACLTSAWCSWREDRLRLVTHGLQHRRRMRSSARWVPGVW